MTLSEKKAAFQSLDSDAKTVLMFTALQKTIAKLAQKIKAQEDRITALEQIYRQTSAVYKIKERMH